MGPRTLSDTLTLSNQVLMPQLGFGVYESPTNICVRSCSSALETGYRHIDTAQYYGNEAQVGHAVMQSGISRESVFLTTKILAAGDAASEVYQRCLDSVEKLDPQNHFVDLFLVHSPNCSKAQRKLLWQALERLYHERKAKSIGVSNFGIKHIEELKHFAGVWPPHVNQIEVRPIGMDPTCTSRTLTWYNSYILGCNNQRLSATVESTESSFRHTAP